jgi:uncharacterized protein with HEPN domain
MPKSDDVRLRHMRDAAREAISFTKGRTRDHLNQNRMLVLSLVKCVEIVGEAAAQVTAETRTQYPSIPWADIVGMRNRLIHAYFDVDLDRVWDTVTDDLPPLIVELEKVVGSA